MTQSPARARTARLWRLAALWLAACAAQSVAAEVDGVYQLNANSDCARVGEEGGALMIRDGVLYGIGSQCRMLNPLPVRNMEADLVDMLCAGGGTEWTERALVMRGADGGLILVWNGYAFTYPRCEDRTALLPDTRPRPRPRDSFVPQARVVRPRPAPAEKPD